jgi:hypothetical protein
MTPHKARSAPGFRGAIHARFVSRAGQDHDRGAGRERIRHNATQLLFWPLDLARSWHPLWANRKITNNHSY